MRKEEFVKEFKKKFKKSAVTEDDAMYYFVVESNMFNTEDDFYNFLSENFDNEEDDPIMFYEDWSGLSDGFVPEYYMQIKGGKKKKVVSYNDAEDMNYF